MKWKKHSNKKKGILKKLLSAGFVTVVISYIMVATFLSSMLYSSSKESNLRAVEDKKQLLLSNAERISEYSVSILTTSWTPQMKSYQQTLEIIAESTGTSIIITVAGLDFDKYIGNYLAGEYIDDILKKGKTVSNEDDISAFKEQENLLALGVPVTENQTIYGGVLMCTTASVVNKGYAKFVGQVLTSVVISLILTFVL